MARSNDGAKLKDWLIFYLSDSSEVTWDFTDNVLRNKQHKRFTLKLWLAATAKEAMASDMRRRELA